MTLHARNFTQDPDAAFTQLELNVKTLQDALLRLQSDWEVYAGGVTKAIDRLTAERDAARAEALHLRKKVVRIEQLAERYDSDMNDAGRDIITRLRYETAALAIRAALKSEADHD